MNKNKTDVRPRVGISSCLLGQKLRYDGRDKENFYITRSLSQQFEFIAYCPEVAIGMGVPRAPIQLVNTSSGIRALGVADPAMDMTDALKEYANSIKAELETLSGYIFTARSPSCGVQQVKLVDEESVQESGIGIFAARIMQTYPALPVIEDEQLEQTALREQFIAQVLAFHQQRLSDRSG